MDNKFRKALKLFLVFFKIGAFTFGGGYAMISLIQKEACDKKKWISEQDIFEIIAIAESTPGPIAINSATFIRYKVAGTLGSVFATLGVVTPSFIIILLISYVLRQFESIKAVRYAFSGIRAGVLALIIKALISMYKQCPKDIFSYILAGAAFVVSAFFEINALYIILSCAVLGLSYSLVMQRRAKK